MRYRGRKRTLVRRELHGQSIHGKPKERNRVLVFRSTRRLDWYREHVDIGEEERLTHDKTAIRDVMRVLHERHTREVPTAGRGVSERGTGPAVVWVLAFAGVIVAVDFIEEEEEEDEEEDEGG